jgi:hypothetical protein
MRKDKIQVADTKGGWAREGRSIYICRRSEKALTYYNARFQETGRCPQSKDDAPHFIRISEWWPRPKHPPVLRNPESTIASKAVDDVSGYAGGHPLVCAAQHRVKCCAGWTTS